MVITTQLKEVDGVLMLPISPETKAQLSLTANSLVEVELDGKELVIRGEGASRGRRSRYKLSELLADYEQMPRDMDEDREWLNFPPVGRELL